MTKKSLQAVILTSRSDLRNAIRDELKRNAIKADSIHPVKTVQECLSKVSGFSSAFLCLDWDIGAEFVLEVLDENSKAGRIESHPCFLIASKIDDNIVAAATEYQVAQIHTGEISASEIKDSLKYIFNEAKNLTPIKKLMLNVANCRKRKDYEGANIVLEPLYNKMGDNPRVAIEYGENLLQLGRYDQALLVLMKASKMNPPQARARHLLAKVYLKKGESDAAIECLKGAQLISPYNVNRLIEMGNLFMDMNSPADAKNSFDEILSFSPDNKEGRLGKGGAMLALGEVNEALSLIRESATTKELASVFNTSAVLAIKRGQHKEGIELYKTALGACGKNSKVEARLWFNMGVGYIKWQKIEDSMHCFKKSEELDPSFENSKHNLAVLQKAKSAAPKKKAKKPSKSVPQSITEHTYEADLDAPMDNLGDMDEDLLSPGGLGANLTNLDFDVDFDDDDLDD